MKEFLHKSIFLTLILAMVLTACSTGSRTTSPPASETPVPPTRTPFPPSPTPVPVAATVNGERIPMADFQSEVARYKAALDREITDEDRELVVRNMIQLTLLAQAAGSQGFVISQEDLQERMTRLDREDHPLQDWLAKYGYTEESFQRALDREVAAAWMRDQIIDRVPRETEQIHAQQILLYEESQAQTVLSELENGTDFAQLAKEYDPQTRGDLGWFPRGYLTMPELDDTLFALEAGEISDMIETDIGYHIVKVLDKEDSRPLEPDVRRVLQKKALHDWLENQWNSSKITISISE